MNKPLPQSKYNKDKYNSGYDRIFNKPKEDCNTCNEKECLFGARYRAERGIKSCSNYEAKRV